MATRTRNRRFAGTPVTISPQSASRRRRIVGLTLEASVAHRPRLRLPGQSRRQTFFSSRWIVVRFSAQRRFLT